MLWARKRRTEMELTFIILFSRPFVKKEMPILMVGLNAIGKATILYKLLIWWKNKKPWPLVLRSFLEEEERGSDYDEDNLGEKNYNFIFTERK